MARSLLNSLCTCGLTLAIGCAVGAQNDEPEELVLTSGPITFNRQTNLFEAQAAKITQGNLHIEADEALATGIDFDAQSEWRFTGNVRITVDTAVMEADSAVFTFEEKRLSRAEIEGAPASFTHLAPGRDKALSGTADKMSYDHLARTLRMQNGWLQRDRTEYQGCDLIYDLSTGRFATGDSDCENPFRLRVLPDPDQQDDADPLQ